MTQRRDFTIVATYSIPNAPTARIVIEPNACWSAPFHEEISNNSPSPFVETYHTKYAERDTIIAIIATITAFTCRGSVFPVA
jgi:hypothetical protein